jgi:hypothetical protein
MPIEDQRPTDEQRKKLCELMHHAFIALRYLEGEQANDLAYAFHNLPVDMYSQATWSKERARGALQNYQMKYQKNPGVDYVALFDEIFK